MSDRMFGVELECGYAREEQDCVCEEEMLNRFGCECAPYDYDHAVLKAENDLENAGVMNCVDSVDYDGTDIEVRTVPLEGLGGLNNLERIMKCLKDNGGFVTRSDGTHVHFNAPEYVESGKLRRRLAATWVNNQAHIFSAVSRERPGMYACPSFSAEHIDGVERDVYDLYSGERKDINFEALEEHGTIEIRLHEGTLDFEELRAWIMFMATMMDRVAGRTRPITEVKSLNHLMTSLKLDRATRKQLRRKAGITA